ncbi:MAG TPA: sigma 54-interacting transcriptional regulator [Isosphaeraceae bacterium]|nr:sigma 54-interacting transcriptional regulator [Isosphaeraceae bacterium]
MSLPELGLSDLLEMEPGAGVLRFAGRRAVICDATAVGLLRADLIANLGPIGARGVMERFGYAQGWRTAEAMRESFAAESSRHLEAVGPLVHTLQGQLGGATVSRSEVDRTIEGVWRHSFEAEQHLARHGRAHTTVCWTLCGFAAGYVACLTNEEYRFEEETCVARGDAECRVVGRRTGRRAEPPRVRPEPQPSAEVAGLVVRGAALRRVVEQARRVARVPATVLIGGESGTGKERLARLIHDASGRAAGPFVAVNCGAVAEGVLESELFGHARGAFTGAVADRPGLFESAHGGTLLLDEVGEVPSAMQVKLLRALQEREVRRVGENRPRPIDVRVVAATNRDLAADVASGRFRQDLYYRLKVVELIVPPLRQRREDILPLAEEFLMLAARRLRRPSPTLSPEAADCLLRYPWPGNVRELENAVERAVAMTVGDTVEPDDLPEDLCRPTRVVVEPAPLRPLEDVERDHILATLEALGGNQTRAAAQLGIGTATLYRKLKKYRAFPI